jgi:hypothetical protein
MPLINYGDGVFAIVFVMGGAIVTYAMRQVSQPLSFLRSCTIAFNEFSGGTDRAR